MNALLDGPVSELQSRLDDGLARFRKNLRLIGDNGSGTIDSVVFPSAADIHAVTDQGTGPRLPVMMTVNVSGHFVSGARTTAFRFPDVLGTVILTTELPYIEPISEPVDPGSASTAVRLPTDAEVKANAAAMLTPRVAAPKPTKAPAPLKPVGTRTPPSEPQPVSSVVQATPEKPQPQATPKNPPAAKRIAPGQEPSWPAEKIQNEPTKPTAEPQTVSLLASFPRYVKMGYTHILPEGLDHILFVLGLFLLSRKAKDLIKQITAFTIAHSLTLALALYGVVRLPSSIVEPIIALSIAFVAVENIFSTEVKAWRPYVVFAFGLVHGLGFAGALQDAGLARQDMLPALVGFNIGVELGQLSVVALAWLAVARFQKSPRYRPIFAIPASVAIALVAVFWTVQRVL